MKLSFNYKKIGMAAGILVVGLYLLYLLLPFALNPFIKSYAPQIENIVKEATGFDLKIEDFGITTSADLTIGAKFKSLTLSLPDESTPFFTGNDVSANLRLIPLLRKNIQLGKVAASSLYGSLIVKKDGTLVVQDYLLSNQKESEAMQSLPYGLKLSNHLPNICVKDYKFEFLDAVDNKSYYIQGEKLKISDFILDKNIKISTIGKVVFDNQVISNYDIKIHNKIMPKLILDDIVFPKEVVLQGENISDDNIPTMANPSEYTIIDIFKLIKNNQLRADVFANIKVAGTFKHPIQNGTFEINSMSVAVNGKPLPESYAKLIFKGSKTDVNSVIYTSDDVNEKTVLSGFINFGKKAALDLNLKSNAKFNHIIRLIDSVLQSFGMNDLKTVSATGQIDADLKISSDLKEVNSSGYLKVNPSSLKYGLYNLSVDNIVADINLDNNDVNIKNAGFSVLGHPLKLAGTIKSDASADLKLTADNLSLKGLLGAAGQVALLKENSINSGSISAVAIVKGKLDSIKPDISLNVNNINIFNKPMKAYVVLNKALVKLLLDKEKINGDIDINALSLKMDGASVSVPSAKVVMDTKDINIKNSYVLINNSRVDVTGSVKDYMSQNMAMDIKAQGNLASADIMAFVPKELHSMFPYKGSMPISVIAAGNPKSQDVKFVLSANPKNYIQFADVNLLKGKTTKISADMKISGNNLKLSNSGIYANSLKVASFDGGISDLTSKQKLNLNISLPNNISFPIWGMGNSNITANGQVNILGAIDNPKVTGKVNISDLSVKEMNFAMKNLLLNLNGSGIAGAATADSLKFDGISASKLSSKFSLTNFNNLYLSDISGTSFGGKISGKVSYNIATTGMSVDMSGKGLNSMDAVYGAVGIPKALTGTLGFQAKFTAKGITDKEIIRSLKGDVNFDIADGRFVSIGRFENLVAAQNIASNSIFKSAVSALSTVNAVQETDRFKSIVGNIKLSDGAANISNIKVAGPLMSYYVTGVYYIIPNTANLNILGRLDSKVVSYLGPLGQLSAEKLLSYIPEIGPATAKYLSLLTQNPATEKTELIPALTSNSTGSKDFKVHFNGSIEKSTSIKSFKWLSKCDTTEMNLKKDLQDATEAVKNNIESRIKEAQTTAETVQTNVNNIIEAKKQQVQDVKNQVNQTKQDIEDAKNNIKNLWNSIKNPQTNTPAESSTSPATSGESSKTPAPSASDGGTSAPASSAPAVPASETSTPAAAPTENAAPQEPGTSDMSGVLG